MGSPLPLQPFSAFFLPCDRVFCQGARERGGCILLSMPWVSPALWHWQRCRIGSFCRRHYGPFLPALFTEIQHISFENFCLVTRQKFSSERCLRKHCGEMGPGVGLATDSRGSTAVAPQKG